MKYGLMNKGGGDINICWTVTDMGAGMDTMPFIELKGYEINHAQMWTSIQRLYTNAWGAVASTASFNPSISPYEGLYAGTHKITYTLPFFNDMHHNIRQAWSDIDPGNESTMSKIRKQAIEVSEKLNPYYANAGMTKPQRYDGSENQSYTINFPLINTKDETSAMNNKKFLDRFIRDNLHSQRNLLFVTPPLIYEVNIPGIRYMPAAKITSLTVNNKGSLNRNIIGGNVIIPDAWDITFTVEDLIKESKEMWDKVSDANSESASGKINIRAIREE